MSKFTLNGNPVEVQVPDDTPLLWVIRDDLGATGTKFGCGIGICHACVVIVDEPGGGSRTERTCISGAAGFAGMSVRTVEGHAEGGNL